MAVYKEEKTGTWRVIYRYTDWTGEKKQTQKRGFQTKREAQASAALFTDSFEFLFSFTLQQVVYRTVAF